MVRTKAEQVRVEPSPHFKSERYSCYVILLQLSITNLIYQAMTPKIYVQVLVKRKLEQYHRHSRPIN